MSRMLRSLCCQLTAHGKAVGVALRPALQGGLRGYAGPSAILPSQNFVCQYGTGVRQMGLLSLKNVSGFHSILNTKLGVPAALPRLSPLVLPPATTIPSRSLVKWSMQKGKRKSVKPVLKRFKRLHWAGRGIWIRPRAGAKKRVWKKSPAQRLRCKTHVFCNSTQSNMLDKMVTKYWRKMRHYPDDPYGPYMRRENFSLTNRYPREFY